MIFCPTHVQVRCGDGEHLPDAWAKQFDLVYTAFAHHHFADPAAVGRAVYRALRPGGVYAVIDPGPEVTNRLFAPLARVADPGWVGFYTPRQHVAMLQAVGLLDACWIDLAPGFGVALGQRPVVVEAEPS